MCSSARSVFLDRDGRGSEEQQALETRLRCGLAAGQRDLQGHWSTAPDRCRRAARQPLAERSRTPRLDVATSSGVSATVELLEVISTGRHALRLVATDRSHVQVSTPLDQSIVC